MEFDTALRLFAQVCETAAENQVSKILVNSLGVNGELAVFERCLFGVQVFGGPVIHETNLSVIMSLEGRSKTGPVVND